MAPRRHGNGAGGGGGLLLNIGQVGNPSFGNGSQSQMVNQAQELATSLGVSRCCIPTGECLRGDSFVRLNSPSQEAVRVICNNETCQAGQFMHRECFETWEQSLLVYLRNCGRARSWSDRQRHQNLWTKKGYDLAFKACGCRCGRGHLKKDLDWQAAAQQMLQHQQNQGLISQGQLQGQKSPDELQEGKKKKRRHRHSNGKPSLAPGGGSVSANLQANAADPSRGRTGSLSSSTGSSSPPATSETSVSPFHQAQSLTKKKSKQEFFGDRIRQSRGANGIFSRRLDFSAFNSLPRTKLNSYHIKMEDEGNHGNDDTRCFILSTLAALQWSRVSCVLCRSAMLVFDRYPLVDGTFFLSPRQHSASCAEVKVEGRTQYLSAVCMSCLEGNGGSPVRCRACTQPWDGSSLVLGTMYSYDIFAAMPCCSERLKCNSCAKPLIYPHQRLNYFSDYSRVFGCPHCRSIDAHFVKPLTQCYTRDQFQLYTPWP